MARRARRLGPRAALEEDEERPLAPVGIGHLAGEDDDALAVGAVVVERDLELVLDEKKPARAEPTGALPLFDFLFEEKPE